jgi:two-component system response regulator RegX3
MCPLLAPERSVVDPEGRVVVMVVEDEPSYLEALNIGLTVEGFVVVPAANLHEARSLFETMKPDLLLLDVMLPDGSGIDYCREIRSASNTPVIMVSARHEEVDIVLGLEFGASDYVTKPFRMRELVARMRAVLRRYEPDVQSETLSFGDIRIDVGRRVVSRNGSVIDMSRKEFDLLHLLANRLGQVVTREQCLDALWWGQELTDTRTLDTHIKRVRQKIEQDPATPRHLLTIRGVGFRLDP